MVQLKRFKRSVFVFSLSRKYELEDKKLKFILDMGGKLDVTISILKYIFHELGY